MLLVEAYRSIWLKGVDERRYALLRIAFAAVALVNIAHLWPYRITLLCANGIIDPAVAWDSGPGLYLSIFAAVNSPAPVTVVFIAAAAATLLLAWGKLARPMLGILFWFLLSIMQRAPVATSGWDFILLNFAAILLFSPLGEKWNPYHLLLLRKGSPMDPQSVPRYGLVLIQLQVFVIYWQTVIQKIGDYYWQTGDFLTYFMLSHHSRFAGSWVIHWHEFLDMLTYLTLMVELAIPILLWIPKTRRLGLFLGVAFHLSIAVFGVNLSIFSLVMIMTYLAFISPWQHRPLDAEIPARAKATS
ncbi:MAG: HTTM domain-containing protein [Verrucomicrobiales bacterium]